MAEFLVNKELLNRNFEGYKYSSNFLSAKYRDIINKPIEFEINDKYYNFTHLKLISLWNGLFVNHFSVKNHIYYFSENSEITCVELFNEVDQIKEFSVASILYENKKFLEFIPSLFFVNEHICLVVHSNSILAIYTIHDSHSNENWKLNDSIDLCDKIGAIFCYSASIDEKNNYLRLVTLSTKSGTQSLKLNHSYNLIQFVDIRYDYNNDLIKFGDITIKKKYECSGVPDLVQLVGDNASNCIILSDEPILHEEIENIEDIKYEKLSKHFSWSQTLEMITIISNNEIEGIKKNKIECQFSCSSIKLKVFDSNKSVMFNIDAQFYRPVCNDSCRWLVTNKNKLEIYIIKENDEIWPHLFTNENDKVLDSLIEHVIEDEEKYYLCESTSNLDAFTTSNEYERGNDLTTFSLNHDIINDDYSVNEESKYQLFYFINLLASKVYKKEPRSTQILFKNINSNNISLDLCLDYLEDGIVWNISVDNLKPIILHKSTFHALSYISATKNNIAYRVVDSFNQNYIAMVDCNGHLLVYENPNALSTVIMSKPRQSSYNINSRPIGVATIHDKLVILTKTKLYLITVHI